MSNAIKEVTAYEFKGKLYSSKEEAQQYMSLEKEGEIHSLKNERQKVSDTINYMKDWELPNLFRIYMNHTSFEDFGKKKFNCNANRLTVDIECQAKRTYSDSWIKSDAKKENTFRFNYERGDNNEIKKKFTSDFIKFRIGYSSYINLSDEDKRIVYNMYVFSLKYRYLDAVEYYKMLRSELKYLKDIIKQKEEALQNDKD